jgi:hypothetical protein
MNIQLFLSSVLPAQGRRFVVSIKNKIAIPRRVATNQQVVDTALQFEAQGYDVYFAVGGFVEALNPKGQPSREAEHAQWHRCLRIDLDVQTPGENKPHKYATKTEALQGLVNFINVLHLPMPIVIDSGGGFHVYWIFDRDITRDVWQPLADRLKSACVLHGLRADPTATADAARILRMPGTHNFKPHFGADGALVDCANPNSPLLPADPAQFDALLPQVQALQAAGVAVAPVRNAAAPVAQSELSAGVNSHTPYDIGSVIRECSVMTDMLAKHGDGYHNQQWYLMLNAVQASMHTDVQKRGIALALSDGWRDNGKAFDINDFDRTFERAKGGHPFSCATMANSGEPASSLCRACPYYADALPSVGRLGYNGFQSKRKQAQVQQAVAAMTPAQPVVQHGPFRFTPDGRILVVDGQLGTSHFYIKNGKPAKQQGANGKQFIRAILGSTYTIKEIARNNSYDANQTDIVFTRGADPDAIVSIGDMHMGSQQELGLQLSKKSIFVSPDALRDFRIFMSTFLQELQQLKKATKLPAQCGWSDDGDFVWGLTSFHRDGTTTEAHASLDDRMALYRTEGDKAKWQQAFNIILRSGADRQLLLALGIASPLMAFTGLSAGMVNVLSESGTGKTTTSDAVQSIWGDPNKLRLALHDTDNAKFQIAGITGGMPLVLDESTIAQGDELLKQIHTLTQGRQKHRMGMNSKVVAPHEHWSLVAFTSSNRSVVARLMDSNNSDTGGPARVFEILMGKLPMSPAEQSANKPILQGMQKNFGWLAPEICALLVKHSPDDWTSAIAITVAEWDRVFNATGEGRFHSAIAALAEIGATIGRKLGYNFDVQAVKDEAKRQHEQQQGMVKSLRREPLEYVRDYMLDNGPNLMHYVGTDCGRRPIQSTQPCSGELHISRQQGVSNILVIREQHLREYIKLHKGQWDTIKRGIEIDTSGAFIGRNKRTFLANSSEPAAAMVMCFEFNYNILNGSIHAVPTATTNPTTQVLP